MKKNFFTGLVLLLPVAITFWVLLFLINLLTNPFLGIVQSIFSSYNLSSQPFFNFTGPQFFIFLSRLLILIFLFCVTLATGFLARILFINYVFRLGDQLLHRIPFINKIYKTTQDVTHTLFAAEKTSFSQVVLIPYPHSKCYSLGFVTGNKGNQINRMSEYKDKVSVLLLGTPNPMMGFMLIYKKEDIIYLDMKPEEAATFVISCGVMLPEFKAIIPPKEEH